MQKTVYLALFLIIVFSCKSSKDISKNLSIDDKIEILERPLKEVDYEEDIQPIHFIDDIPHFESCSNSNDKKQQLECNRKKITQLIKANYRLNSNEMFVEERVFLPDPQMALHFYVDKEGDLAEIKISPDNWQIKSILNSIKMIPGKKDGRSITVVYPLLLGLKIVKK